jgi:phosphoenolpyruvate carboxylase
MIRAFSGYFVRREPVDDLARFKTSSRPAGKPSRFCKRKIIDNPKL